MASSEDTEITLGAGKLLGLFFLLAAICGVFFSIGYALGKSSGREQAANDQVQVSGAPDVAAASPGSVGEKPSPAVAVKPESQTPASEDPNATSKQSPLTFYKAVQQSGTEAQSTEQAKASTAEPKTMTATAAGAPPDTAASSAAAEPRTAPDVMSHTSPVTGPGTLVVQIAALSREDDAVSLAGALRKKNYNVFVVNNPVTNDKLYHVQVGPFATLAEAQAMKAKLVAEGYNPIIKR